MDKDIKEINETLKRHEEHFIEHDKHFERIEEQLKRHEEHLIEHDKHFERIEAKLKEHDEHFERIEEHLKRHDEDLKELKEMIKSLQEAMVIVEDAVTRKLPALFDGYKMHQEKQERLEEKLEEHSIRIFALEAAKK